MAITTDPTSPSAGELVALSLTGATGTARVYDLTAKPSASALELGLLVPALPRSVSAPSSAGDALRRGLALETFTPDVEGEYSITGYDFREIAGTPSYPGDPAGDVRYQLLATQTGTVYVGATTDLPLRTLWGGGATLRLTICGDTVRGAELVEPLDEHSRLAALAPGVVAALAALVGVAVASLGTELIAGTNDLRAKYEAHRVVAPAVHSAADNTNVVGQDAAYSQLGAFALLNALRRAYLGHATEDSGHAWHLVEDHSSLPVAPESFDLASAWLLMADLRERCFEVHRTLTAPAIPASHVGADAANALTAALPLDTAVALYLSELAKAAPVAAAGESDGIMLLCAMVGAVARKRVTR